MCSIEFMTQNLQKFPSILPLSGVTTWNWSWRGDWHVIRKYYADSFQRDLLRALTVAGHHQSNWAMVFQGLSSGSGQWKKVNRGWFEHKLVPDWRYLFDLVVNDSSYRYTYYPAFRPEWLEEYGYSQFQYISDLKEYWDDIGDEYYQPWPSSRVGYDMAVYDAIKHLSQETQAEIEQLIQSAKLVLQLAHDGGSHDNSN